MIPRIERKNSKELSLLRCWSLEHWPSEKHWTKPVLRSSGNIRSVFFCLREVIRGCHRLWEYSTAPDDLCSFCFPKIYKYTWLSYRITVWHFLDCSKHFISSAATTFHFRVFLLRLSSFSLTHNQEHTLDSHNCFHGPPFSLGLAQIQHDWDQMDGLLFILSNLLSPMRDVFQMALASSHVSSTFNCADRSQQCLAGEGVPTKSIPRSSSFLPNTYILMFNPVTFLDAPDVYRASNFPS